MEPSKRDRRVLKSKRAIRQALVKILSNKLLEKITIKEIAEEADVNRKTFYCKFQVQVSHLASNNL